jgi:hypothetical protein
MLEIEKYVTRSSLCKKLRGKSVRNSYNSLKISVHKKKNYIKQKFIKDKLNNNSNIYESNYMNKSQPTNWYESSKIRKSFVNISGKLKPIPVILPGSFYNNSESLYSSMLMPKQKNISNSPKKFRIKNEFLKQKIFTSKNKFKESLKNNKTNLNSGTKPSKSVFSKTLLNLQKSFCSNLNVDKSNDQLKKKLKSKNNEICSNIIDSKDMRRSLLRKKLKMSVKKKVDLLYQP